MPDHFQCVGNEPGEPAGGSESVRVAAGRRGGRPLTVTASGKLAVCLLLVGL
jgi:hypothetical protein